jgi:hypothetical protein
MKDDKNKEIKPKWPREVANRVHDIVVEREYSDS